MNAWNTNTILNFQLHFICVVMFVQYTVTQHNKYKMHDHNDPSCILTMSQDCLAL